ncbi:hypothetical protein GobsT_22560 [Gemmata obscuriglobus]|uniref:Uncharacterized protein n=1 Tax=Gemmata obscuriglobus TaxID=114 RepID=A0A2Z3H3I8_9BACT|nr:hypothetical protein [Gemmata obscuriglobus]AWM39421.1 hypothetical protein C1280_22145 [Gemmata obscuriglobus]QEG27500.1 hypothetical protein GobsT_22560 [Gemmata obscuriglobus]VTS04519.1 unnamed protein product [Gemmata obscuriglobus UQM 2246]
MRRKRWLALTVAALGLVALAGWAYCRPPAVNALDATAIRSVEVHMYPWGHEATAPPGTTSTDSAAIEELVSVLRAGTEAQFHKCGSRGGLIVRRLFGRPLLVEFLPGHSAEWYEFHYDGKPYRVPRAAFVNAMRRFGVAVPLECP